MKLVNKYREVCKVKIQAGDSALFGSDNWNGNLLQIIFPRLFSYAIDTNLSMRDVLSVENKIQLFNLPLSQQAYAEFLELQQSMLSFTFNPDGKDQRVTIWKDGVYISSRYYHHCFKDVVASKIYSYIWKSKVQLRIKVFAWLLVYRLSTRDVLGEDIGMSQMYFTVSFVP